jgi:DNA repair/transcription protein MET18/MMS19
MFALSLSDAVDQFVDPANSEQQWVEAMNALVLKVHREVSFEELVGQMGAHLTHKEEKQRERASLMLGELLTKLPDLKLVEPALSHFVLFFSERTGDFPSIEGCLKALKALVKHHLPSLTAAHASTMAQKLVMGQTDGLHVPGLSQSLRQHCFELLQQLLFTEPLAAGLRELGTGFINGYSEAMEEEKDPRCLLICLRSVAELVSPRFGALSEEDAELLFDSTVLAAPVTHHLALLCDSAWEGGAGVTVGGDGCVAARVGTLSRRTGCVALAELLHTRRTFRPSSLNP